MGDLPAVIGGLDILVHNVDGCRLAAGRLQRD